MRSAFGNISLGVESRSLEVGSRLHYAVGAFLASASYEDALDILGVLDLFGSVDSSAQESPVCEHLRTVEGDGVCLHSSHREAGHSPAFLLGYRPEVAVDEWHEFIAEYRFEGVEIETEQSARPCVVGHSVCRHHDERLDLPFGDEVVHDEVRPSLVEPCVFVLAPSVLDVEYGVFLLCLFVLGRGVDEGGLQHSGALRPEEYLLDVSVGNVLFGVEVSVMCWNLYSALPTGGAVIVGGTGVIEDSAVDREVIVVEAFVHGTIGCSGPEAVTVLSEDGSASSAESQADDDRGRLRGVHLEAGVSL